MNVLVVGSGGREHALCWQLAASPLLGALWCAPGNAGIENEATCVALDPMNFDGLVSFCREEAIDFVVVGPEAPLCAGLVDRLEADGIAAFGPRAAAARIEGSKGFMKDLCARYGVPTAAYRRVASLAEAEAFIAEQGAPVVVKADGLAAGKGVVLAATEDEALNAARDALDGAFGEAGAELVIEEMLVGEEASYFALIDGETVLPLETAQDHKAVGEGDTGPNTGGMGAYSPAPAMTPALCEEARERIVERSCAAWRSGLWSRSCAAWRRTARPIPASSTPASCSQPTGPSCSRSTPDSATRNARCSCPASSPTFWPR